MEAQRDVSGRLFVVGTPIGNLEDVSQRMLRVLSEVDIVLCEDTRVTRKLFERHEISTGKRLRAFHQHSLDHIVEENIQLLRDGHTLALVTDAGTPCISDPGWKLVDAAREAGVSVEVVPGPSAVTSALSVSGFNCAMYVFLGFPPVKKGRQTFFEHLVHREEVVVLYESPHRIRKTLEALAEVVPGRRMALARELTKMYEEVLRGTATELLEELSEKVKGEIVLVIDRDSK